MRVAIGEVGGANTDITQVAEVMKDDQEKWRWLLKHLVEFSSSQCQVTYIIPHNTNTNTVSKVTKDLAMCKSELRADSLPLPSSPPPSQLVVCWCL